MLLPFGCCLQAEVVHCVLDESGFSAVTVQPIVHAVEHALQILTVEFVHVPGERRQAAVNGIIHLRVRFVLDSRECGSPRIGRVDRVLPARLRVNGRFVEDAMLGMGAPPNARNFCSFSSVRLWMASSVPFFSTGSFAENLTTSDASAMVDLGGEAGCVSDVDAGVRFLPGIVSTCVTPFLFIYAVSTHTLCHLESTTASDRKYVPLIFFFTITSGA